VQIVLIARKRASLAAASAALLIATWFTVDTYLPDYQHTSIMDLLLLRSGDTGVLGLVTSGRLGTTPTLANPVGYVMDHSALSGFGPSGIRLAYDSAWVEVLAVAGVIGVGLLCLLFLTLGVQWFTRRRRMLTPERRLAAGLIALLAMGSIGGPVFTMNRFASIAWIILPAVFTNVSAAEPKVDNPETMSLQVAGQDEGKPGSSGATPSPPASIVTGR
jgi:hypothetical protein